MSSLAVVLVVAVDESGVPLVDELSALSRGLSDVDEAEDKSGGVVEESAEPTDVGPPAIVVLGSNWPVGSEPLPLMLPCLPFFILVKA